LKSTEIVLPKILNHLEHVTTAENNLDG
jgi:hypothetical protein